MDDAAHAFHQPVDGLGIGEVELRELFPRQGRAWIAEVRRPQRAVALDQMRSKPAAQPAGGSREQHGSLVLRHAVRLPPARCLRP